MRLPATTVGLGITLEVLLAVNISAQAPTCAERLNSQIYPRHRDQEQVNIPAQGLDPRIIAGLEGAETEWNQKCQQSQLPEIVVDTGSPPPAPDSPYNSASIIQVIVRDGCSQHNRADCEPEWNSGRGTWHAATYSLAEGSTINIPTLCPQPRQNGQGQTVRFSSCDAQGSRILWDTEIAKRWMIHEIGHALGLNHDDCDPNSVMQFAPKAASTIRNEHCSLAEELHCTPALLPPGETCPEITPSGDEVAFKVRVSGLPPAGEVTITRSLFTATSSLGFQELATGNGTLHFFPAPTGSTYAVYQKQEMGSALVCEPSSG